MKKLTLTLISALTALALLAGCNNTTPASTPASAPEATSTPAPASQPASQADSQADSTPVTLPASIPDVSAQPPVGSHALDEIYSTVAEAAGIGATIPVTELDLRAGGVNTDNIVEFVGFESQTSSEDGGIVIIIETQPDTMDAVATDMIAFRDSRLDDRYAEFATAMEHTAEAVTAYNHDLVIYAVSATGDYQTLNDTISQIFSDMNG